MTTRNGLASSESAARRDGLAQDDWVVLWLLRLLFLTYFMAIGTLQPFMAVYYHSLGFDGRIIGLLGSISPLTTFLVAPIMGMISDRRNPITVLFTTIALSLIGQLLVPFCRNYRSIGVVVCATAIFSAPVKPLIDSLAIGQLLDRSQFGKLRLWSVIGTGAAASFSGRLLDGTTTQNNHSEVEWSTSFQQNIVIFWRTLSGFNLVFFVYAVLHVPVFIAIWLLAKAQHKNKGVDSSKPRLTEMTMLESLRLVFRNPDASRFFLLVFSLGASAGVGDNFGYVRIKEVGGSGTDMGLSRLLCSVAGALMFWNSGKLGAWLGMGRVMIFSLLSVATRFALFSVMDVPWHAYIAEMIRGMTFGCFWSTSSVYATQLAPPEVQATTLQLLNGAYNGIGRSAGAILGGRLQEALGTNVMFRYCSVWNYALAVVLTAYQEYSLLVKPKEEKRRNRSDVQKKLA